MWPESDSAPVSSTLSREVRDDFGREASDLVPLETWVFLRSSDLSAPVRPGASVLELSGLGEFCRVPDFAEIVLLDEPVLLLPEVPLGLLVLPLPAVLP